MNQTQLQAMAIAVRAASFKTSLGVDKSRAPRAGETVAAYADRIRRSHVRMAERSITDLALETAAAIEDADLVIFRARLALAR